jgi:hypothetical protein
MAAFGALNGSLGPGYPHELATVAAVLRERDGPGRRIAARAPAERPEARDRLVALAEEAGAGGLLALDINTE